MKSPLIIVKQFLKQLSSPFFDGRILLNIDQASRSSSSLKYILLNPSVCFDDIVSQARSVILAGGTMKPVIYPLFMEIVPLLLIMKTVYQR